MTQWTKQPGCHRGEYRPGRRCASVALPSVFTLRNSMDIRGVAAPSEPPG